ncbi:MAG: DUF2075 domain-containing protein [Rhizobiaceae bacterium]|nr:DUF2075 domain-containing protein [Rhizobiaceae bacterium]MCZ8352663.1 DUF2075 domain-containing protein [Rhizobium sp.]
MVSRSYYDAPINEFLNADHDGIMGRLATKHTFDVDPKQKSAWAEQVKHLKEHLVGFNGHVFFEFAIPRMGKRVDVVVSIAGVIFVIEYKTGQADHSRYSAEQVFDYALDLKNFHEGSHNRPIVPIVVSMGGKQLAPIWEWSADQMAQPLSSNGDNLSDLIREGLAQQLFAPQELDHQAWANSGYRPTPTIIEAARALYEGHSVEDITRHDAGAENLSSTSDCIFDIISHSRRAGRKSICFVTGVPGAGKTLAGLNISTHRYENEEEHAVFLSGNGPLVIVLREALARDEVARAKAAGEKKSKKAAATPIGEFIQNIHHFRDEYLHTTNAPPEHVVVFDEAQRAWNRASAEKFMIGRGEKSFPMSEPEFLISVMDRRQDWATIVCLIGGGQEINTGEAGLIEWFNALQSRFPNWDVYHSGQLVNPHYSWGEDLASKLSKVNAVERPALHLSVSIRSFRAEKVSDFVGAVIDGDAQKAKELYNAIPNYRLAITRDLNKARQWLRNRARGSERTGLVASSGALRLRPEGIFVKAKIDPAAWFLNHRHDVRSSYYLEEAATEFDIQGLELDWAGVCWDADVRKIETGWIFHDFSGTRWKNVNDRFRRAYRANAYRVLLTRARQGMVIYVPLGDPNDPTRLPEFYDGTYSFLRECGLGEV